MYESTKTPGKKFGSAFAGKRYDEAHSEGGLHKLGQEAPEQEAKETPEFEAGEQEGGKEQEPKMGGDEQTGEEDQVASEHGHAHKVVIHHDEKTGRHTVQSHHKDGHVHSKVHAQAHEAHKAAHKLAGVPSDVQPEEKTQEQHSAPSEDGFAMPELS